MSLVLKFLILFFILVSVKFKNLFISIFNFFINFQVVSFA